MSTTRKRYSISMNPLVMENARKAAGLVPLSRWIESLMLGAIGGMQEMKKKGMVRREINEEFEGHRTNSNSVCNTD